MIERQTKFELPSYTRILDATFVIAERDSEEKLSRILATTAGELMQTHSLLDPRGRLDRGGRLADVRAPG